MSDQTLKILATIVVLVCAGLLAWAITQPWFGIALLVTFGAGTFIAFFIVLPLSAIWGGDNDGPIF